MTTKLFDNGALTQCEIRNMGRARASEFVARISAQMKNQSLGPFIIKGRGEGVDQRFVVAVAAEHGRRVAEIVRQNHGVVIIERPAAPADHGEAGAVASDGVHLYLIIPDTDKAMGEDRVYNIEQDEGPDLEIIGRQIARIASGDKHFNNRGRWTELAIYRTAAGKFVATEIGRTANRGERDRHSYWICSTEQDVVECLGFGRLAKDLYRQAGIDAAQAVA